jgi:hypothetical protein
MFLYRLKILILRILGYEKPLRVALLKYLFIKYRQFRPHYETILLESALQAKKLGYENITVLELGVAGGNGIIALEKYKKNIEKLTKVKIKIVGFDTGKGLPKIDNKFDLPFYWKTGQFKHNKGELGSQIDSKIIYGDVNDTMEEFIKTNPENIATIFFDLDLYTSTKNFLNHFSKLEKYLAPRVYCYFDEIHLPEHWINEHNGELLAIKEFNNENQNMKIGKTTDNINDFRFPLGKNELFLLHNFNHKDYNKFIGIDDENSLHIGDTRVRTKIF